MADEKQKTWKRLSLEKMTKAQLVNAIEDMPNFFYKWHDISKAPKLGNSIIARGFKLIGAPYGMTMLVVYWKRKNNIFGKLKKEGWACSITGDFIEDYVIEQYLQESRLRDFYKNYKDIEK